MMKKVIKKLLAALLAVAMLCAMAVPALAADDAAGAATTTGEGEITIDNVVTGHTYKLYRILDLEYHADTKSYRYTANKTWKAFITSRSDDLRLDDKTGTVTWENEDTADNGTAIQAFANAAGAYAKDHSIPEVKAIKAERKNGEHTTDNSTSITFDNLPLGWYLVVSDLNNGAICSLGTTAKEVTIKEKNGEPTIDKYVFENGVTHGGYSNDASVGDTVKFQINVAVLDGQPHNYVIHDAMSAGLTFDIDSVVVTRYRATDAEHTGPDIPLDTLAKGSDYTVKKTDTCAASAEITGCTFEIKFEDSALKANDIITVQYTATVNENAVIGVEGNPNKTILEYNNKYTAPSTTTTYVWGMGVRKFANLGEADKDHALADAEFRLYKMDGETKKYAKFTETSTGSSIYKLNQTDNWTTNETDATKVKTPANGNIKFKGLDAGTYYLEETTAPTGYNKLSAPIKVEIISTLPTAGGTASYTVKYGDDATADNGVVRVENKTGTTLPSTGGMGTTLFYVIGGGLMVAAVVLLVTKKRMENK